MWKLIFFTFFSFQLLAQKQIEKIDYRFTPFYYKDGTTDENLKSIEEYFYQKFRQRLNERSGFSTFEEIDASSGDGESKFYDVRMSNVKVRVNNSSIKYNTVIAVLGTMIKVNEDSAVLKIEYAKFLKSDEKFETYPVMPTNLFIKEYIEDINLKKTKLNRGRIEEYFKDIEYGEVQVFAERTNPKNEIFQTVANKRKSEGRERDERGNEFSLEKFELSSKLDCELYRSSRSYPTQDASKTFDKWLSDYDGFFGEDPSNSGYALFYMNTDAVVKLLQYSEAGWSKEDLGTNYVNVIDKIDRQIIQSMEFLGGGVYLPYCETYPEFIIGDRSSYDNLVKDYGDDAKFAMWIAKKGEIFQKIKTKAIEDIAKAIDANCEDIDIPKTWSSMNEAAKIGWITNKETIIKFSKCKDDRFLKSR
jgi:hypothetical protein